MTMLAFLIAAATNSSASSWGKWLSLVMAVHAFYCIFNSSQRNAAYGEFYKLRFMKRMGWPASSTTAVLAFILWGSGFVSFLLPKFWNWDFSGVLAIGLFAVVMLSSFLDARAFRAGSWR
jgi:hypothetical protein